MRENGFTLVEVLMALGGMIVLALLTTSFLFSILGQRDQAVAESLLTEQTEATMSILATAIRSAKTISVEDNGRQLKLEGKTDCWLFRWEEAEKALKYGWEEGEGGCSVPEEATERLTGRQAVIKNFHFELITVADSSRTVILTMDVEVYRPLWQVQGHYQQTFVNLIDSS